jgi:hypothetical protein
MTEFLADQLELLFEPAGELLTQLFNILVQWCFMNPFEGSVLHTTFFQILNLVTLYIQAVALVIVVALRIALGIKDGVFANGGDPETGESTGSWLFKSLASIALVCMMPTLFRYVAGFSLSLGQDIASFGAGTNFEGFISDVIVANFASALLPFGVGAVPVLYGLILGIITMYYIVVIVFQALKRQIQLVILSLIAPLVAVASGTKDSSTVANLMKESVAIGLVSGIQLLLLGIIISTSRIDFVASALTSPGGEAFIAPLILVAMLGALKNAPRWIERYTETVSMSGNSGRVMAAGGAYAARSILAGLAKK